MTRDGERLEPIAPAALPPVDSEMISTVLRQRSPQASASPIRGLCHPLQATDLELGAICFTTDRGHYGYRDERFVDQIAQFLSSTIARLLQAETIRRQAFELGSAADQCRPVHQRRGSDSPRRSVIEEEVVIVVSDNGCGISPELLPRVFSMFVQAAPARQDSRSGLGLGLTIARSITEMHGGSVSVTSDGLGGGSTFTVRLPRLEGTPQRPSTASFTPAKALSAHPRRVMIVDDNDDLAAAVGELLEDAGHHVVVLHDGVAALDRLHDTHPEVALLDIGLPVMDGYHLAREIRARLGVISPFLIAVTGYGQAVDAERSRDAGFNAHFVKPFDHVRLLQAIEAAPSL